MMWRTNLADGVAIDNEPNVTPVPNPQRALTHNPIRAIPEVVIDSTRVNNIARLFLQHISGEHQFTRIRRLTRSPVSRRASRSTIPPFSDVSSWSDI
jgi:hypothetical protein